MWTKRACLTPPVLFPLLLQASCGFCQQKAVSPLASLTSSDSSSSSQAGVLLDECQDDINVCPFLAASGLCSSGSMWVETQCARSCGHCSTAASSSKAEGEPTGLFAVTGRGWQRQQASARVAGRIVCLHGPSK